MEYKGMTVRHLKSKLSALQSDVRGATTIVYALSLPVIIGLIAINVEMGHYRQQNARFQSAADMAAISAALELKQTSSYDNAKFAGEVDATVNGFRASIGDITVETPIVSGPHAGKNGAIVRITQEQERYFSNIFKPNDNIVHTVEATALIQGGQPICVLALDPAASGAITVTGSTDINIDKCAMHSNSNANPSFNMAGAGQLTADCISASGGITTTGSLNMTECDAEQPNRPTISDPYAHIGLPPGWEGETCLLPEYGSGKSITLRKGRHCNNGKNISVGGPLHFADAGTYIFDNSSLIFKSNGAITGHPDGVTLIFTNGSYFANGNGGSMDLKAPAEGTYKGIIMYGDRDTSDPGQIIRLNGNQQASFEGALYFPVQKVDWRGGVDAVSDCTQIVAREIEFSGNSALTNRNCVRASVNSINGGTVGVMLVN